MALALRLANGGIGLGKLKYAMEAVVVPVNSLHTTSERMKQRNPFSMAEAGQLKLKGKAEKKKTTSEHRLTGTNDVIYRKNLPRVFHSWETGVAYLKSETYRSTYGDQPVWVQYRRNQRGTVERPRPPRPSCFTPDNHFTLNNPCPLCRDEYLVVDYRNPELLNQFIDHVSGEIMDILKVGLCRYQHDELKVNILLAKNHGYLVFDVPFRNYDYRHYYESLANESDEEAIKAQHLVNVSDKPVPYPDTRPYAYVKYPIHAPMVISDHEL